MKLRRRNIILVDGMDNTGKTTLVQALADEFKLPVAKSPGPLGSKDMMEWVDRELRRMEYAGNMIYERFPLFNEPIYGPPLRGYSALDPYYWLVRLWDLKARHPIIIYCRPQRAKVLDFGDREQMAGVVDSAELLLSRYDHMFLDVLPLVLGVIPLDYDYEKDPDAKQIIEKIKRRQRS